MSRAELENTLQTGLVRGGKEGVHYVSDNVNSNLQRARLRLALKSTPEVRVALEVPKGSFSSPNTVGSKYGMPGGGSQRIATGDIPTRVRKVYE